MKCDEALALIPGYLDGELKESQAAPLRRHLLDCQPCRGGAQGEKNLKRWFQTDVHAAIPQGFAARIARRAFAGDTGQPEIEIVPVAPAATIRARRAAPAGEDPIHRFVLQATAAAALVVLALSVALRSRSLPSGSSLQAADGRGEISVEQALERLDQLNLQEATPVKAARVVAPVESNGAGSKTGASNAAGSNTTPGPEAPRRP